MKICVDTIDYSLSRMYCSIPRAHILLWIYFLSKDFLLRTKRNISNYLKLFFLASSLHYYALFKVFFYLHNKIHIHIESR